MFSMSKTASSYADVFLPISDNAGVIIGMVALVAVGLLLVIAAIGRIGSPIVLASLGVVIAIGGLGGIMIDDINNLDTQNKIADNMASNVKDKYSAELRLDKSSGSFHKDLEKVKSYVLTFENGSSSEYKMKFTKSGEPMIVEEAAAPSVQELNGGEPAISKEAPEPAKSAAPAKTVEPKTAPTPSELEESAKK